jgi:hypothetical protein
MGNDTILFEGSYGNAIVSMAIEESLLTPAET